MFTQNMSEQTYSQCVFDFMRIEEYFFGTMYMHQFEEGHNIINSVRALKRKNKQLYDETLSIHVDNLQKLVERLRTLKIEHQLDCIMRSLKNNCQPRKLKRNRKNYRYGRSVSGALERYVDNQKEERSTSFRHEHSPSPTGTSNDNSRICVKSSRSGKNRFRADDNVEQTKWPPQFDSCCL